nr:MAG TPA_asm: hypothetical protein [Caudoviricetes sp.]
MFCKPFIVITYYLYQVIKFIYNNFFIPLTLNSLITINYF